MFSSSSVQLIPEVTRPSTSSFKTDQNTEENGTPPRQNSSQKVFHESTQSKWLRCSICSVLMEAEPNKWQAHLIIFHPELSRDAVAYSYFCLALKDELEPRQQQLRCPKPPRSCQVSEPKYKCESCNKAYTMEWMLKGHVKIHVDTPKECCKYCCKRFRDKECPQLHLSQCRRIAFSRTGQEHRYYPANGYFVLLNEGRGSSYRCKKCDVVFSGTKKLALHLRERHKQECLMYFCEICGKEYIWRYGINLHYRKVHPEYWMKKRP